MAQLQFVKATKKQVKLRLALFGPSGAGKTGTALRIATGIVKKMGGKIAVYDTEHYSSSRYSDGMFLPDGSFIPFEFDVINAVKKDIDEFITVIEMAEKAGYSVLIVDSMSHSWQELLAEMDLLTINKNRGNSQLSWAVGTPKQKKLVKAILEANIHLITTMRSSTEWNYTKDDRGKLALERLGLKPEQGKNIEYEFDLLMELNTKHSARIIKDRLGGKYQDKDIDLPDESFGELLIDYISEGSPAIEPSQQQTPPPPASAQPEPEPTQTVEKAQKRLKKVFETCYDNGYNGYNNTDEGRALIKADLKHFLDADTIAECKDIDLLNNMEAKLNEKIKSGTPFDHWDNKIVVETEAESDYPEDIAYLLETAQHEAESRDIKASLKSMLLSEAKDYADKKNIPGLNTIIASITGFPAKKAEITPEIAELHNKIDILHGKLIDGKINNYDQSKHLTASVDKWLGTKTSKACMDVEKLTRYIEHLESKFEPEQEKLEV